MGTWTGSRLRRVPAIAAIAMAIAVIGGLVTVVTLTQMKQNHKTASLRRSSSQVVAVKSAFKAVVNVTPPVAASNCATPTVFTYSGTVSATAPGTVKYQWVYSSRKPGPVQTVTFTTAGHKAVAGATVTSETAGGGWSEIKMISPSAQTSSKARYELLCGGGGAGGITATAAIQPAAETVSCVTAPPELTATGSITASDAGRVTYYWVQSDGTKSDPATLTFTAPGTQAVEPLTISPPGAPGSGDAVLVVTSPVTAASSPATYTLTCMVPVTSQSAPAPAPASAPAPGGSPLPPPESMSVTVNAATTASLGQPYSGTVTVTGGDGHYVWSAVSGLPAGLTATANGATLTISGTPTVLGSTLMSGQASDGGPTPLTAGWELYITVVLPTITITVNAPGQATVGQPYLGTLTAAGGDGTAFRWSVIGLPQGLTGTANGATFTISGTPTGSDLPASNPPSPGTFNVDAIVFDSQTSFDRLFAIVVEP